MSYAQINVFVGRIEEWKKKKLERYRRRSKRIDPGCQYSNIGPATHRRRYNAHKTKLRLKNKFVRITRNHRSDRYFPQACANIWTRLAPTRGRAHTDHLDDATESVEFANGVSCTAQNQRLGVSRDGVSRYLFYRACRDFRSVSDGVKFMKTIDAADE